MANPGTSTMEEDPWYWDVDRVVKELCTDSRSWQPRSSPPGLPEPASFELKLRENEVNGETLLMGSEEADFFPDIGVKIARHKVTLRSAIQQLRQLSPYYNILKFQEEKLGGMDTNMDLDINTGADMNTDAGMNTGADMDTADEPRQHAPAMSVEEPIRKKRRLAPTIVSLDVDTNVFRNIPTEADRFLQPTNRQAKTEETAVPSTYLEDTATTELDIMDISMVPLVEVDEFDQVNLDGNVPLGHRLKINRFFKHRGASGKVRSYTNKKPDTIPGLDDSNEVLPAYGESEDEYDTDTWNEIQDEERRRHERTEPNSLSEEIVKAVLVDKTAEFVSEWKERKLPKLQYKAHRIWSSHRNKHMRRAAIAKIQSDLIHLDARIKEMSENLESLEWHREEEIRTSATSLQPSIESREETAWTLELLKSVQSPEKVPRPSRTAKPRPVRTDDGDEEELVTSESDADIRDFIIEDDEDEDGDGATAGTGVHGHDTVLRHAASQPINDETVASDPMDYELLGRAKVVGFHSATGSITEGAASGTPSVADGSNFQEIDLTQLSDSTSGGESHAREHTLPAQRKISSSQPAPRRWPELSEAEEEVKIKLDRLTNEIDGQPCRRYIYALFDEPDEQTWHFIDTNALIPKSAIYFPGNSSKQTYQYVAHLIVYLFDYFCVFANTDGVEKQRPKWELYRKLAPDHKARILGQRDLFPGFGSCIRKLGKYIEARPEPSARSSTSPHPEVDEDLEVDELESSAKKRRKPIVQDRAAQKLRVDDRKRLGEQEERREKLRNKLAASGSTTESRRQRFIINETKTDDDEQGFIYVPDNIAERIKDHQISGIRFMWNQIVMDSDSRQGCLLAHTMGLGKTMQVVTLLVTIAMAAASDDPTISSQIPADLKKSKTLVLAPPALVNNWEDEFLLWAPDGHHLGPTYKVDTDLSLEAKTAQIEEWTARGGILIMGYSFFLKFMTWQGEAAIALRDGPNIVVADEAHYLKNSDAQISQAVQSFRTQLRIALTGSPLANNVEEYHALISWVAPNYLSDRAEFRAVYARPIEQGLSVDATRGDRRIAMTTLKALTQTIEPKVHRQTIAVLKNDLPPKKEFLIYVPLTDIQREAYEMYLKDETFEAGNTKILAKLNFLGLLCNHPSISLERLEQMKHAKNRGPCEISTETDNITESVTQSDVAMSEGLMHQELKLLGKDQTNEKRSSWKILLLERVLDESRELGDKVLIFSQSLLTLNYIEKMCRLGKRTLMRIDGSLPTSQRQVLVKDFNAGKYEICLISTTAGGLGLNITAANRVVIMDSKFNPQHEQQAVGRAYRIGQKKPVFVYRFLCGGTFEEKLHNRTIFKMQLASRVVDKQNPIPKGSRLEELMRLPTEPPQQDLEVHRGKDAILDAMLDSEELRKGLRSIVMSDTFEEEEVDNLEPEDHQEVQRLMHQHRTRAIEQSISHPGDQVQPSALLKRTVAIHPGPGRINSGGQTYEMSGTNRASTIPGVPHPAGPTASLAMSLNGTLEPVMGASTHFRDMPGTTASSPPARDSASVTEPREPPIVGSHSEKHTLRMAHPVPTAPSPAVPKKSHRIDDLAALQEFGISLKEVKGVKERTARLPNWAIDAVDKNSRGGSASSKSPAPPKTRPHAKNPFQ